MPNKFVRCIFVFTATAVFITGCSSSPEPVAEPDATPEPVTQPAGETYSVAALLSAAQQASQPHERYEKLTEAATQLLDSGDIMRAGVLLSLIDAQQMRPMPANQLTLQKARFAAELHNWQRVLELTEGLDSRFNQRNVRAHVFQLRYQAYYEQSNFQQASLALIQESRYHDTPNLESIWQTLTQVPAEVWRQDITERDELVRGWYALMQRITLALDNQHELVRALEAWQRAYPNHAADELVQQLLNDSSFTLQPQQIAVLLPLSGPLAGSGSAVRNGILAALHADSRANVVFFDTAQLSATELHQQLVNSAVDVVIGPLDRDAIEQLLQAGAASVAIANNSFTATDENGATDATTRGHWQQLWLNQAPANYTRLPTDAFFALDSESEAESSVRWLSSKGHRNILILGPDTPRGRGTANTLEQWWQAQYGSQNIHTGFYTSSSDMVEVVQEALRVKQSDVRINRFEQLVNNDRSLRNNRGETPELHHEVRSRQDIDAIYLLGDANQARLLKPYIDVNLSAFGSRIPVYASSLVHEEQRSRGENDLDGIYFSDAPFTLQANLESDLKNQLSSAMQPWSLNRQRLVAMGYDAMQMATKLPVMQRISGYSHPGLTGILRISAQKVERELDWAKFEGHEIKLEYNSLVDTSRRN